MRRAVLSAVIVAMFALVGAASAFAASGVEHLKFAAGPYLVRPGANLILTDLGEIPKPMVNGFMTRVEPNLHYAKANGKCCGAIPRVDVIHLHHGVWLTDGAAGAGEGNGQPGFLRQSRQIVVAAQCQSRPVQLHVPAAWAGRGEGVALRRRGKRQRL